MTANGLTTLAGAIERRTKSDGTHPSPLPGLSFYRASGPIEHTAATYEPSLCVIAQGVKEVLLGGKVYRYDSSHSLLVSVELPVTSRVVMASPNRPCLAVCIALDVAVVGELLADGAEVPSPDASTLAIAIMPAETPLLDAITRLVALLHTPQDIRLLAPLILREITYRVLTGPQGARLRQMAAAGAPAQRIATAIRWLKNHYADQLRIEALAKRAKMSPSAFHLHFKHVTAMSPLQYQKRMRLQEARQMMLGEGLDAAQAAFRVGYESPSQFSREYRRMFGAPPRQDVTTVRGEVQTVG